MGENFWTKISAISGVVAVIIAVWLFLIGRSDQSKKLEVELIARSTLVDENMPRAKPQIEVLYAGRKIPNYVILQIRIKNSGGQPIRSSDYEEHVRLKFDNIAEILSIEQILSRPKELQITPSIEGRSSIVLPMVLLNQTDWYMLEIGVAAESGKKPTIVPTGRIVGVKQIVFTEITPTPPQALIGLAEEPSGLNGILIVLIVVSSVLSITTAIHSLRRY
jgi:hypothetical protein